ncbi:MAG: hypothetical protein C0601_06160 [Candidatus Muiribacterium halophilum]|uniref:Outer membrane lipoprotein BamD-like domain-containing protein n=1 Tax=Muiribacterium halophilum TaxID=2053465 RepID=A0A2N5ZGT3_MUIH1|nr:MAG: hypothetical protein C0601_06160 [Candidatus Muirbacterium halophilum]
MKKYLSIAILLYILLFSLNSFSIELEKTIYNGDDYYFIHEFERAQKYFDAEDYEKANDIYNDIYLYFSNRDQEPEVLFQYGKSLFKTGKFSEATRIFKKLDKKYKDFKKKDELYKLLEALNEAPTREKKDSEETIIFPKAFIEMEEANKNKNTNADKYEKLEVAKYRFKNKEYKKAIELFKEIEGFFEGKQQAEDIYYMTGKSFYELKNIEDAVKYYKKYQNFFRFGKYQNQVNKTLNDLNEIQQTFSNIQLAKEYDRLNIKKIDAMVEAGFLDKAIISMKKMIELDPANPVYHFKIASLYNMKKNITGNKYWTVNYAEDELEHYLKILNKVETPEIFYNIAKLYQDLGEHEQALQYWQKIYDKVPNTTIGKVAKSFLNK